MSSHSLFGSGFVIVKFKKQNFVASFPFRPTLDFCCIELKLIIEIDGEAHFTLAGQEHDRIRDQYLITQGFKVLRIPGYAVIREDGNVIDHIRQFVHAAIANKVPSPPAPLPEAEVVQFLSWPSVDASKKMTFV